MKITKSDKLKICSKDKYKFDDVISAFGSRLKLLREVVGLTQAELAEQLGVSRGSISYYEKGERVADIEFLDKVSVLFDVSYDYLLGFSDCAIPEFKTCGDSIFLSDVAVEKMENLFDDEYIVSTIIENEKFEDLYFTISRYIHYENKEGNFFENEYYEKFLSYLVSQAFLEIVAKVKDELQSRKRKAEIREKYKTEEEQLEYLEKLHKQSEKLFEDYEQMKAKAKEETREYYEQFSQSTQGQILSKVKEYFENLEQSRNEEGEP